MPEARGRSPTSPERIRAAYAAGREAFPAVPLPEPAFRAHVMRLSPAHFDRALYADLFLAFACLERIPEAVRILEEVHLRAAASYLRRHHAYVDAAELVQELTARLLGLTGAEPKLAIYSGTGPLGAFVRVAAVRLAQTSARTRSRRREDAISDRLAITSDPERLVLRKEQAARVEGAVRAAIAELDPESKQALRHFYYESRSLEEIAELLGVSRATAARRVSQAREKVLKEAKRHARAAAGARAEDAESMLRWITSNLDLGLSVALGARSRTP